MPSTSDERDTCDPVSLGAVFKVVPENERWKLLVAARMTPELFSEEERDELEGLSS